MWCRSAALIIQGACLVLGLQERPGRRVPGQPQAALQDCLKPPVGVLVNLLHLLAASYPATSMIQSVCSAGPWPGS